MTKNYKSELQELTKLPQNIYAIYIIPCEEYDGFWGKNGYTSYDFVFEGKKGEEYGWLHWEGDVINIFNDVHEYELSIDCPVECGYIRLFSSNGLEIDDLFVSSTTIKPKGRSLKYDKR